MTLCLATQFIDTSSTSNLKAKPPRITLAQRYLTFIGKVQSSEKPVLHHTIGLVENDTRTVTGRNLRNILLLTDQTRYPASQP